MAFTVTRSGQSLVPPSETTPTGTLHLSVVDRVPGLRHMVRSLHVFTHVRDAAKVIRGALSKALVPYYPFAGRLAGSTEHNNVRVECTGEGAWFVGATLNRTLEDVTHLDHPLVLSPDDLLPCPHPDIIHPLDLPLMMQYLSTPSPMASEWPSS